MAINVLTIEQQQEYSRDKKVAKFLSDNAAVVGGFPPLAARSATFTTHMGELENLLGGKQPDTKGITKSKGVLKIELGIFYESVCGVSRAFLIENDNEALAVNFNITKAKIVHLPDPEVKGVIEQLNAWITSDLIPDPLFTPYGITALVLANGLALATDFDNAIGEAPAVDAGKTAAGINIANKIEELKDDVTLLDLLVRNFITSNATFYNGFQAVKVIDDIGVHYTGLKGDVEKNGVAVKDAIITCAELGKTAKTNILGHYEIISMRAGTYEFTCTSPTAGTQTKIITIKKGRTIEVDWEL